MDAWDGLDIEDALGLIPGCCATGRPYSLKMMKPCGRSTCLQCRVRDLLLARKLLKELREWHRSEYQSNPELDNRVDDFLQRRAR